MMISDINLYKGDTGIGYIVSLSNERGDTNLNNTEIIFKFGNHVITPKNIEGNTFILAFENRHTKKAGFYKGCFKVKYSDGRIESYPSAEQSQIKIRIKEC